MSGEGAAAKTTVTLEDKTYDVVVLGAGGAGLSAAIEAQAAGANVVVIEKMPYVGGNTILSYAELACPNNWLQEEQGIKDSPELMAKEMWEGGGKVAKKEMVDIVVNNATAAAEWLRDEIGVKYQDYLVQEGGHSVPRAVEPIELGPGMINPLRLRFFFALEVYIRRLQC
ncbi:FAD-dependent oxidoreductase [Holdemania massiliensis]|uniref:FAD-binding protein n=1 Tax=Holdemania massiliensis TaxID=1468449 RepID=A0A6N7S2N8_9FIRM|nr:FAD-dependent oxidoreductase [Holdemania massiliensis]MSA70332.1 FAD-binding protein [Holdemania massiliensis]MSA88137.1 FAD-binding protein [Holdemania massiliensis]MSB76966.1 FAD-binding protein [Holdemania massiliensis]MSC31892.1 FAD-binding protein [Holdemania massiliensis]MSC38212.1 FAD-binding protein [Holdemania massiliensis]